MGVFMDRVGWQFWIEDGKRLRLILVAIHDLKSAEELALSHVGSGNVISYQEISARLATFLKLRDGMIMEPVSVDFKPRSPLGTPKRHQVNAP
jgi:hypothetical protein